MVFFNIKNYITTYKINTIKNRINKPKTDILCKEEKAECKVKSFTLGFFIFCMKAP